MLCVQPTDPLDGGTGKLIRQLIYACQLRQWNTKCGMRRPSLGQNEDDLSRLTTVISPTSASLSSSTQTDSPSDNNDNNSKRNNNNNSSSNNHNNNNNNNNNGCIKADGGGKSSCADLVAALSAQYLPNLINSSEWQNCRKRKERQDSTSSISQDRKLIRSNSEEHLPNCQEVIRRVSSHEDFKKRTHQPPLEANVDKENIIEESVEEQQQLLREQQVFEKNLKNSSDNLKKFFIGSHGGADGGGGSGGGHKEQLKPADGQQQHNTHSLGVHLSHHHYGQQHQHHHHHHHHSKHRLSPCRDILKGRKDSDSELDGEHERRRHCERFSKTRPPPGRKSVSPRNRTKQQSSTKHGPAKDKGGNEHVASKHDMPQSGRSAEREKQTVDQHAGEPTDILSDYNDNNLLEKNKAEIETPSPQSPREKLPWDQSFPNDDTPVVCQRFADHKFEHANKMDSFDRVHPVPSNVTLKYYGDYRSAQSMQPSVKKPIPPANNMFDERIKTINRKLSGLKKKLTQFEDRFERDNGYRPTHGDKTADGAIKSVVVDIHKLRKEKNQIKADLVVFTANSAAKSAHAAVTPVVEEEKKLHKMKDTIGEIQKRLCEKRETDQRNENLELMSSNQLVEEKASVQRALLYLESIYGRPASREERDAARPLYDRYRLIKRLVNRANSISGPCGVNSQMPTILEHEALAIVGTTTPSTDISPPSATSMVQSPTDTSVASTTGQSTDDSETTSSSITENIHSMTADELWEHYDAAREEKKELRRTIKEYEQKFEETTGRKMLKSDRKSIEETYALYKQKKAKLRLIDALFKKQMLI